MSKVQIRFDDKPGHVAGRFIEVEDVETGASIKLGEWQQDGTHWLLVFDDPRGPWPILLWCPQCHAQHIDAPEPERGWTNPPHKSHLCHSCGTVFRPADFPTNGVATIATRGAADTWPAQEKADA